MPATVSQFKPRMSNDDDPPAVQVRPDLDPWLTLTPEPRDGATAGSVHMAQLAQKAEREAAIAAHIEREGTDLLTHALIDSAACLRVQELLPRDLSADEKRDASAVAIRLHDPRWQIVSRYYAADALLVELRKFMQDGHGYATDRELRELADRLAGVAHMKRLQVWTGQIAMTARTWTKAALGFLSVREDR